MPDARGQDRITQVTWREFNARRRASDLVVQRSARPVPRGAVTKSAFGVDHVTPRPETPSV